MLKTTETLYRKCSHEKDMREEKFNIDIAMNH